MKDETSVFMKETLTRSLTGIVFVALIIFSLIFHPLAYLVVFGIFCTMAWFEFIRLYPESLSPVMKGAGALAITGNFILIFFIAAGYLSPIWLLFPAVSILLLGVLARKPFIIASLIYLLVGFSMMHFLAFSVEPDRGYSPRWILFTLVLLWMNDMMAYVSGRLFGKHPMWPSVSPAKTWEGSLSGTLFTLGLAIVLSRFYPQLSVWEWIGFALIVIIFGSLGDLLESWIKRKAGVKDSGRLMPGHGGVLDRFDSFLLAIPFITIYFCFIL